MQVTLLSLSTPAVNANDPQIYAAAAATMLVAVLVAAWLPARRSLTLRAELLRS